MTFRNLSRVLIQIQFDTCITFGSTQLSARVRWLADVRTASRLMLVSSQLTRSHHLGTIPLWTSNRDRYPSN
jgi:hypothetical protein